MSSNHVFQDSHKLAQELSNIRSKHNLVCILLYSSEGTLVFSDGDISLINKLGLYTYLFSDETMTRQLIASLEEQILPRQFAQGNMSCFATKININVFAAWFNVTHPVLSMRHKNGIEVEKDIQKVFTKM